MPFDYWGRKYTEKSAGGSGVPKIFTDEDRDKLKIYLLEIGFELLREGGVKAVNIDELARRCYIAKGTFYNLFEDKSQYLYEMSLHERAIVKSALKERQNEDGLLTANAFLGYLRWMYQENRNIFAYMTEKEQQYYLAKWPAEYIENQANDEDTMNMLCHMMAHPRADADWKLACNLMKMLASSIALKDVFIEEAFPDTVDYVIKQIVGILCEEEPL